MFEPLEGFFYCCEELVVADGLQQKVEGIHFVALKGILLEGRRKNDAGVG